MNTQQAQPDRPRKPLHGYPDLRTHDVRAYPVADPHVDDMLPGDLLIVDRDHPVGPTDVLAYLADDRIAAARASEVAADAKVLGMVLEWQREIPNTSPRFSEIRYPDD